MHLDILYESPIKGEEMWSSFKFITTKNSSISDDWYNNPCVAFEKMTTNNKLSFLMHQCVLINYLEKAYGVLTPGSPSVYDTGLLYLITTYKNDIIIPAINEIKDNINSETNRNVVDSVIDQLDILLNISSFKLDTELCFSVIETYGEEGMPRAFEISDTSFYRPYLLFLHFTANTDGLVDVASTGKFKITDTVTIPSFSTAEKNLIVVSYEQRCTGYEIDVKKILELDKTLNIGSSSIISYLYGYNWGSWTFNGFLGVLAGMCLELDANVIPHNSLMWLYYFLYRKVFGWKPHASTRSNSLALSSDITIVRRCVLAFIAAVRDRYKVQIDDVALLGDLLNDSKDTTADNLHKYLNAKDASSVSVEMYTAFKRSVFGTFEELDFKKSKKQSLDNTMALQARSDKEVSASLTNVKDISALPLYLKDSTFSLEAVLLKTGNGILTAKNAAGGTDTDADAEQIPKESDNPEEEVDSSKPKEPDSDANNPSEDPATMPESDNDAMDDEDDTHTDQPLPAVSDKRGVKLELSLNENTDTVLYRFELKAYVDTLLANPPKYLDVQTITYLKKLKAFWWNCLSVQTLYDVLNSMVKVPKEYRIKKTKQGLKNDGSY